MGTKVEISDVWVRRIRSPLTLAAAAGTGISVSFCPLFIYRCGESGLPLYHPFVLFNYAVIVGVFWYHASIASQVVKQISKSQPDADSLTKSAD